MPYVGSVAPESLVLKIATIDGFDLSTITSLEITVQSPKKATLAWTWAIASQSAAELRAEHVFSADGKDAKEEGDYTVSGWLVSATTRRRIKPVKVRFERYG